MLLENAYLAWVLLKIINKFLLLKVQKFNSKIAEGCKIDTLNTQIHDRSSLSWLGTGTSIKSGSVKLILWAAQTTPSLEKDTLT